MMRFILQFSVMCWALAMGVLSAEEGGRTCRILFFQAPRDFPKTLHLSDGVKWQEVKLPSQSFSQVYELADGDITLGLASRPDVEAGLMSSSVQVPATMRHCYLLITERRGAEGLPIHLQVVDASSAKFNRGQMMWFNLTDHDVGGRVGERTVLIKAKSNQVSDEPRRDSGSYLAELAYAVKGESRPRPLSRTHWNHDPRGRMVMFIYQDPVRSVVRVSGILDHRERPKGEADGEAD